MFYNNFLVDLFYRNLLFFQFVSQVNNNTEITSKWPKVVTEDVKHHTYQLKTALSIASSKTKGHTLLLIPSEFDDFYYPDETRAYVNNVIKHHLHHYTITYLIVK